MGKRTGDFQHESIEDPKSIAAYLEALANGFQSGRLLFCSGEKELVLKPEALTKFSLKVSEKEDATKVTLRFTWKDRRREAAESERLIIDSPDEAEGE